MKFQENGFVYTPKDDAKSDMLRISTKLGTPVKSTLAHSLVVMAFRENVIMSLSVWFRAHALKQCERSIMSRCRIVLKTGAYGAHTFEVRHTTRHTLKRCVIVRASSTVVVQVSCVFMRSHLLCVRPCMCHLAHVAECCCARVMHLRVYVSVCVR